MESKFDHSCCIYCLEELKDCTKCFTIGVDLVNFFDESEESKMNHFHLKPHRDLRFEPIPGVEPQYIDRFSGNPGTERDQKVYDNGGECAPKYSICWKCLHESRKDHRTEHTKSASGFTCCVANHAMFDESDGSPNVFDSYQSQPYSVPYLDIFTETFQTKDLKSDQIYDMYVQTVTKYQSERDSPVWKPAFHLVMDKLDKCMKSYIGLKCFLHPNLHSRIVFCKYEYLLTLNQYIQNPEAWELHKQEQQVKWEADNAQSLAKAKDDLNAFAARAKERKRLRELAKAQANAK